MRQRRALFDAVSVDGTIIAMGGITANVSDCPKLDTVATNMMEFYDVRNDTWMNMPTKMPTCRCAFTSHVMKENELYVIGGQCSLAKPKFKIIHGVGMDTFALRTNEWLGMGMLAGNSSYRSAELAS